MQLRRVLRGSFLAGLLLVAPLAVTVFVLGFVFERLFGLLGPVVRGTRLAAYTGNVEIVAQLLALGLVLVAVTALGYLAQRSFGERLFGGVDRAIGVIPLVSTVYSSVRQVGNALVDRSTRYERVVLVEYPREGLYSVGFVTGRGPDAATEVAEESVQNVFLPNSPNPTAGRLVLVPESRVHETEMGVRRGVRLLVTTGIADTRDDLESFRRAPTPDDERDEARPAPVD